MAAQREYRFDQDRLLFGAYCLKVDDQFEQTREWFKAAGLNEKAQELYAQDPNRFPMINLLPMYASPEQRGEEVELPDFIGDSPLDTFCDRAVYYRMYVSDYIGSVDTDIVSVDVYPLSVKVDDALRTYMHWMRNLDILAEACRETGRDLWVITQAAGMADVGDGEDSYRYCKTAEDQRWQNYVAIAFGAKAIS
jgi:hypothetical protein